MILIEIRIHLIECNPGHIYEHHWKNNQQVMLGKCLVNDGSPASLSLSPPDFVLFVLSDPAKSHNDSVDTAS